MSMISMFGLSITGGSQQSIQKSSAQNFTIGETNPFVQLMSMMTGGQQASAQQDGIYTASSFNHGVVGANLGDMSHMSAQNSAIGFLAQLFAALDILQGMDSQQDKSKPVSQQAANDAPASVIDAATPTVMSI